MDVDKEVKPINVKVLLTILVVVVILVAVSYLYTAYYKPYSEAKSYCERNVAFHPKDVFTNAFAKGEYYYYSKGFGEREFKTRDEAFKACVNYKIDFIKKYEY